jgi:hypothetical protein
LFALLLLAVGCGGGGPPASLDGNGTLTPPGPPPEPGDNPRPAEAPDVVLLSVSGRNLDTGDLFCPPECNVPYLGDPGAAAEAIVTDLTNQGLSVDHTAYIAALLSFDDDMDGQDDRFGFLDLIEDLQWIQDNWIADFDNPTRIVILAHSHGCVWAHIATSVLPDVHVEVLVSLDGVCFFWEADNGLSIDDYIAANGNPWSWDISMPCAAWDVPGVGVLDTNDVAFSNVRYNIEVLSNGTTPLAVDEQENYRPDGTRVDIESFHSTEDSHTDVDTPGTQSMLFVLDRLALTLGLP